MIVKIPRARIERQIASRPEGYWDEIRPAIFREMPAFIMFDTAHAAWKNARVKYTNTRRIEQKEREAKKVKCERCSGPHATDQCPIPADMTPEIARNTAKRGGCCGSPAKINHDDASGG